MNLKQKLIAATVFFAAASSALADTDKAVPVATAFTTADVASLFDKDAQSLQLAALSAQEMRETEGAWVNYAVGGFAGGLYNGISYYGSTSNRSWGGWTTAIGTGVVGGAVGAIPWWSAPIWGGGIALTGGWAASR